MLKTLNNNKENFIYKWAKDLNKHIPKEDTWMGNKHMKRCLTLYVIREMQIETMRYHYSHIRIARIQSSDIPHAAKNVYQQDLSSIAGANVK